MKKRGKKLKLKVGDLSKKLSPLPIEAQVKAVKERKKQMGPKDMKAGIDVEVNELEIYIDKPEPKKQETEIIDYEMVEEVMRKYNLNEAQRYKPRKRKLQHEKKFKIKRTHSIKVRKSQPLNKFRICTMDCEAVTFNQETKEFGGSESIDMVGFYDGENYYQFTKGIELLDYIWDNMDKYNKCYIYAHNFSGYDIYAFLDDLRTLYVKNYSVIEINGRFVEFSLFKTVRGKRYIVTFRDSYRLMPDKLDNLGKAFGYPKTEQPPFDHNIYALPIIGGENYYNKMYNLVTKYNKNDCVILYNIIYDFFSLVYGYYKSIPLTIPALAFKVWKKKNKVKVCSDITNSYEFDDYIRRSYSGGRTEVFKMFVDNDKYCYVDVNSLYPYIMEKHEYPIGKGIFEDNKERVRNYYDKDIPGFYKVKWVSPSDLHIPILWQKVGGKLTFPLNKSKQNKGDGCYALPELKLAEREGYQLTFEDCVIFPKTNNMFRDYVNDYKNMKFEGGAKKVIAKLFSNCFSSDTEAWTTEGWKKWDELKQGMQCLTVNPKTKRLEYYPIRHVFLQDYEGDMCHFKNENIDMLVTPNHRVRYLINKKGKGLVEEQCYADEVPPVFKLRAAGKFDGCSIYKEDFVKLLGWIITEGHYYREGGIKITQSSHYNYEYINEIKRCLDNLKIPYKEYIRGDYDNTNYVTHDFYIGVKHAKLIKKIIPDKNIQLEWLTTWSQHHLQLLFWTMMKGDGSFRKQKGKANYVSKNMKELEMFQVLATKIGIKARLYYSKEYKSGVINLKLNRGEYANVSKVYGKSSNIYDKQVPYKGKVWCVSLDDREFLVRRNNKTFFSLQSLYGKFGQKTAVMSCVNLDTTEVCDLLNQGFVVDEVDPNLGLYNIEVERFKYDIVVSWSSYITALARVYMWEGMKRCNFDIAYMDTDSFVINKEYVDRLWLDPKLYGAFKREYEIKRAMFISPKFYLLDAYDNAKQKDVVILKVKGLHDVITKGIAAKGYDYAVDFILDHAKNEKKINVSSIVQFKMSRRLKDKPRSGSSRLMVKRISLNYDKRKVCPDGVETEPW